MNRARVVIILLLGLLLCNCGGGTPKPKRTVARFSGDSPAVTDFFWLETGSATFDYQQDGRTDYASPIWVKLLDQNGQWHGDTVANDSGDCHGTRVIHIRDAGQYQLLVEDADGEWTVTVKQ